MRHASAVNYVNGRRGIDDAGHVDVRGNSQIFSQIFSKIVLLRFLELSANSDELSVNCQKSNTTGLAKGRTTRARKIDARSQPSGRGRRWVSGMSFKTVPSLRGPIFSRFRAV